MLGKLIKYDLKNTQKFMCIFYSLCIVFAIFTRIFLNIENSLIFNIIGRICSGTMIAMIANIIINNLMRYWVRFKNNLFGDEAYLTHTLPVKKSNIYSSKFVSALISLFIGIVVIIIGLFISYYSKENLEVVKNFILPFADIMNSSIVKILFAFFFIFFLESFCILESGYTGIILGHRMNTAKIGFSVLFGFLTYMATQTFAIIVLFISALFNDGIMNLFHTVDVIDIDLVKTIIWIASFVYIVSIVVIYFVNIKLLKQGVNVD